MWRVLTAGEPGADPRSPSASAITAERPGLLAPRVPPRGDIRWLPAGEPVGGPPRARPQPGADSFQAAVGRLDRLHRRPEQTAQIFTELVI
jgi:hypothetical protein